MEFTPESVESTDQERIPGMEETKNKVELALWLLAALAALLYTYVL